MDCFAPDEFQSFRFTIFCYGHTSEYLLHAEDFYPVLSSNIYGFLLSNFIIYLGLVGFPTDGASLSTVSSFVSPPRSSRRMKPPCSRLSWREPIQIRTLESGLQLTSFVGSGRHVISPQPAGAEGMRGTQILCFPREVDLM